MHGTFSRPEMQDPFRAAKISLGVLCLVTGMAFLVDTAFAAKNIHSFVKSAWDRALERKATELGTLPKMKKKKKKNTERTRSNSLTSSSWVEPVM